MSPRARGPRPDPPLAEYRQRRDFRRTPEPSGGARPSRRGALFVVQKHDARRLHYDFRLELDGVLKSWAVPKGPSLDPRDKRLAVQTEDHPLEYGRFEGVIPEGEYGGGPVLLWDRGTWTPIGDPQQGLRNGHLAFTLAGAKLRGAWHLVRLGGRPRRDATGRSWLLVKAQDETARTGERVTESRPESVASGRSIAQVAHGHARARPAPGRTARPAGSRARPPGPGPAGGRDAGALGRPAPLPAFVPPQLATLVAVPPAGDGWLHEMKFDGYRILGRRDGRAVRLLSRTGGDWTARFPAVAAGLRALPATRMLVDGEVALVRPDGTTSFQALQQALSTGEQHGVAYFVFDLLHLDGRDLTGEPLEARKTALQALLGQARPTPGALRFSTHVVGRGEDFFREACRHALEGVVSKRRDAPYASGRGRAWLKIKCVHEQEFVVGGFTEPQGTRVGLGALLLGVHDGKDGLAYAGKVGTGFTGDTAARLRRRLDRLGVDRSPFRARPPGSGRARWVKPEVVVEVTFSEWTRDGRLRHPSFKGLREDKPAADVVRERPEATPPGPPAAASRRAAVQPVPRSGRAARAPAAAAPAVAGVRISHPDRVVYPDDRVTKLDLARYYEAVAERLLPQAGGRPTSLLRCPDGLAGECFYQKHAGGWTPRSLGRVRIREKDKTAEYVVVEDVAGLVSLVQMGVIEVHTWNARADRLEAPDRLVFDLDPGPEVPWDAVVAAAHLVRARLEAEGLRSFVKTTGGKGLHVVTPIDPGPGWDTCVTFARGVADALVRETPRAFTTTMAKAARRGRIFLDYLRNQRGATSVAAYSARARPGAPAAVPVTWERLGSVPAPDHFTVLTRATWRTGAAGDPWAGYDRVRQALPRPRGRSMTRTARARRPAARSR